MTKQAIGRIVSVLTGAAVLFVMQQELGVQLYIALPVAMVVYMAVKVGIGLALGDERLK